MGLNGQEAGRGMEADAADVSAAGRGRVPGTGRPALSRASDEGLLYEHEELLRLNLTWSDKPDPREDLLGDRWRRVAQRAARRLAFALLGPYLAQQLRFRGTLVRFLNELARRVDQEVATRRELEDRLARTEEALRRAGGVVAGAEGQAGTAPGAAPADPREARATSGPQAA